MDSPFFFEETTYWSDGDERAHFEWLERIACVREIRGVGRKLFLELETRRTSANDLRELKAVYRRYHGDLDQLDSIMPSKEHEDDVA